MAMSHSNSQANSLKSLQTDEEEPIFLKIDSSYPSLDCLQDSFDQDKLLLFTISCHDTYDQDDLISSGLLCEASIKLSFENVSAVDTILYQKGIYSYSLLLYLIYDLYFMRILLITSSS